MIGDISLVVGALVRDEFPALCLVTDADDRVLEANEHTQALLGGEIIGKRFGDLLVTFARDLSPRAVAHGDLPRRVVSFTTFSGLPTSFTCWFAPCGERVVVVGGADPREDIMLRRELLQLTQELGVRTRELQKSNASLEHLAALRNQFLGMAAHDLRSPLLGIMLAGGMLKDSLASLEPSLASSLDDLLVYADQMRVIIDGFLDMSQAEAGQLRLQTTTASLLDSVTEASDLVQRIHGATARIRIDRPEQACVAHFDPPKMRQVFVNVLNNAVQHSDSDAPVAVSFHSTDDALAVRVHNDGAGIPAALQADIFRPFVMGNSGPGHRHVGLGLAIARAIVDAHRGSISLTSAPGEGTTVTVRLPIESPAPA